MNDSALRQDILDELEFEPSIDANDIGVTVEDGIVTLTGHVPNYSQKRAAERVVARVKGVRGIAEAIVVRPPHGSGVADDEIAKRAVETLKWSTLIPDDKLQVKVQGGWVTLTGKLEWNYQKTAAADAIRDLKGVTGVTNQIDLTPRVTPIDVKRRIEDALKRSVEVEVQGITVDVASSKVTLTGHVRTWNERKLVRETAWATPGVAHVSDQLTIG